jgi:hypothetical protein
MPVPTGTVSMSNVNSELRRSTTGTISLGESQVRALADRPSGSVSLFDCRGKSIVKSNIGTSTFSLSSGTASSGNWWGGNGIHQRINNGTFTQMGGWTILGFISGTSLGNAYQVRVAQTSTFGGGGSLSFSGLTNNTFATIATSKSVTVSHTGTGFISRTFTITMREVATSTVVSTLTGVTLECERF